MQTNIQFHKGAEEDILFAIEYYEEQRSGLGLQFYREITDFLAIIKKTPKIFVSHKRNIRKAVLRKFPYGIFYIIKKDQVTILTVFSGRMNPKTLSKTLFGKEGRVKNK